jgi:hypothetical protein
MTGRHLRDQIASIESDIEQLAQALEGCRKAIALSKMAIVTGGIWILVYLRDHDRRDCGYHWWCRRSRVKLEYSERS